ncbi:pyridoxal phosphate-dependent aminotransferase [Neobacillus drentensis]|uniref:MalY/PatB family protein n=1 Tax=Neobacillus drentensis TaxID=220684 RepID=UPI001F172429|nr:MalY/PatB family protein [Neobacillus drentensis]ULT58774.1 pyridoxal phosphate-dependent aminotransferase [Neobacillus drentensis]
MNMEEFVEKYKVERNNTTSLKWDLLEERFGDPDLLAMWVADMDFRTSDSITEALTNRVNHGVFGYSYVPQSYFDAYFKWMEERYSFPLKKEWIRYSTGVVAALYWFINAFTEPEDSVIILTPVYYPFHNAVRDCGRKLITCPLNNDNGIFTLDYDRFEQAIIDSRAKLYIHCSPHNPAGRVWTEEEQDKLFEICKKHNVLIVSDEIHQDFTYEDHKHIPAAVVKGGKYRDLIITVNSASKTFNLAALIHSNIIITDDILREKYDNYIKTVNQTDFNTMGLTAAEAGYSGGGEWLESLKSVIYSNFVYARDTLNKELPEIKVTPMEGTYLMFINLNKIVPAEKTKEFIQDRCRLAVDFGEWFGTDYKGYVRLNLATTPENVKIAITNIIKEAKLLKENDDMNVPSLLSI